MYECLWVSLRSDSCLSVLSRCLDDAKLDGPFINHIAMNAGRVVHFRRDLRKLIPIEY